MYRMPAKDPSSFQWLGSFQAPEPWALVLATQHSSKAAFIISGSGPAVGLSHQEADKLHRQVCSSGAYVHVACAPK